MPRRPVLATLVVVLCWMTGAFGPAAHAVTPVPAAEKADDWAVEALSSGSAKSDRPLVYLEGPPGSVLSDKVVLTNTAERDRTFRLRGVAPDDSAESPSKDWVGFAKSEVRVPARTRAEVPFHVTVPEDGVPGDHRSAVRVQGPGGAVDVPLRLRVTGRALPALGLEDVSVDGGKVRYTLVNRGNTVITPQLSLVAEGLRGTVVERAPRSLDVGLAPGERITRSVAWPGTPTFDRVKVTLTATASGGAGASAETTDSTIPWPAIGLTALVLAGGGGWWLLRRARGPREEHENDESDDRSSEFEGDPATEALVNTRARRGAAK